MVRLTPLLLLSRKLDTCTGLYRSQTGRTAAVKPAIYLAPGPADSYIRRMQFISCAFAIGKLQMLKERGTWVAWSVHSGDETASGLRPLGTDGRSHETSELGTLMLLLPLVLMACHPIADIMTSCEPDLKFTPRVCSL